MSPGYQFSDAHFAGLVASCLKPVSVERRHRQIHPPSTRGSGFNHSRPEIYNLRAMNCSDSGEIQAKICGSGLHFESSFHPKMWKCCIRVLSLRLSSRFFCRLLMFFLCVVASTNLFALHSSTPVKRQKATRRHVRRVYWNPVLKGSHESMIRQNEVIDELQLPRIANEEELLSLEVREELVPVSDSRALRLAPRLGCHSPLLPEMDAAVP